MTAANKMAAVLLVNRVNDVFNSACCCFHSQGFTQFFDLCVYGQLKIAHGSDWNIKYAPPLPRTSFLGSFYPVLGILMQTSKEQSFKFKLHSTFVLWSIKRCLIDAVWTTNYQPAYFKQLSHGLFFMTGYEEPLLCHGEPKSGNTTAWTYLFYVSILKRKKLFKKLFLSVLVITISHLF